MRHTQHRTALGTPIATPVHALCARRAHEPPCCTTVETRTSYAEAPEAPCGVSYAEPPCLETSMPAVSTSEETRSRPTSLSGTNMIIEQPATHPISARSVTMAVMKPWPMSSASLAFVSVSVALDGNVHAGVSPLQM